jgi:phospholipase A1
MKKVLLLTSVFLLSLFASVDYDEAYRLYKEGDFNSSLGMFQELVTQNSDDDAAYILAYMYEHGEGCDVNKTKAQEYYKIAAKGYYWEHKANPLRDSKKVQKKIYATLEKSDDEITRETVKQYTQSLYNIKAYKANYFLPMSYRYGEEYQLDPDSPHKSNQLETEFQVSLKYDFASNLLGLNEIYSIAYTQRSYWQLYVDSAYFRESNYNPEFFAIVPVSDIPYLKGIRVDIAHQSNGRGGDSERSWNYVSGEFYFQTGFFFTRLKFWKNVISLDYNEDLIKYLGHGEIKFIFPYKKNLLTLTARNPISKYRATTINYSYPFFGSKDLFIYVKAFKGYGETLIDYNNEVNKIAIGFSISR